MTERRDLRDLVGEDVPAGELRRLEHVDSLLRSVPGPPAHLPASLTHAVTAAAEPRRPRVWSLRQVAVALPVAAAFALVFLALGMRIDGGAGFEERAAIPMQATDTARGAAATVRIGEADEDGNWPVRLDVRGLPRLPEGGYYVLWLAKDGEYAATCGYFGVHDGEARGEWTVSYRLRDYDTWVVTARMPDAPPDAAEPWLLRADVSGI